MNQAIQFLKQYIDGNITYKDWNPDGEKLLSLQLSAAFDFYLVELLDTKILLLKPVNNYTPSQMEKWASLIEDKSGYSTAFLLNQITPYMTRKFLKDKVGFIVPDKQVSLPFLAMHIRNEKNHELKSIRKFTPVDQVTFLYILYTQNEEYSLDEIADKLQISMMSATRAIRNLTNLGLLDYSVAGVTGRKKIFKRIPKKEYYSIGKRYLDNPVRDTVYIKKIPEGLILPKADLSALGEQTMLGETMQQYYALPSKDRKILNGLEVSKEEAMDKNLPAIQLTRYDVGITNAGEYEDPISMILGLSERDERIEMAIDELMQNFKWFVK